MWKLKLAVYSYKLVSEMDEKKKRVCEDRNMRVECSHVAGYLNFNMIILQTFRRGK